MESKLATINDIANKTFDFVIIGGGLSGCVLASRLTENPNVTVAVLEAGKAHFDDPLITVPHNWTKQVYDPEYDWVFRTTKQTRATNAVTTPDGGPDPSFYWSRGKGLGGSSCMNFLYWTRPSREEMDAVERLGNTGWNWDRFFEASKRSEKYHPTPINNDPEYLDLYQEQSVGDSGPISVSFGRTVSGIERHFQKALKQFGVEVRSDGLGGSLAGTFKSTNSIHPQTGTRSTAATGYLIPALERSNLKVLTTAYARRIISSNDSGELVATAVEFEHGGQVHVVNVSKEALLCAGTIKSPHILELSGIGDRAILEPLNIPVSLHLPSVGTNLQDHLILNACICAMREEHNFVTSDTIGMPDVQARLLALYGQSEVPTSLALSGVSFVPIQTFSDRAEALIKKFEERVQETALPIGLKEQYEIQIDMLKNKDVPDIEIVVFPYNMHPDGSGKPYVGLLPSIGHPFARGTIHAGSNDPADQPIIEPNYLAESLDLDILLDSMKFIRKLTDTPEWKAVSEQEVVPGLQVATDDQMLDYAKKNLSTTWHACGTCSMMPKEKGGVVDTRLKVYGTRNIRVADLSILPLLTSVHTQATTYGIAEQAADIIRADHSF